MVRGPDCWITYHATLCLCGAHSSVGGAAQQNRGCHVEMLRSLNARLVEFVPQDKCVNYCKLYNITNVSGFGSL
jgi:hypothetical protein